MYHQYLSIQNEAFPQLQSTEYRTSICNIFTQGNLIHKLQLLLYKHGFIKIHQKIINNNNNRYF